MIPPGQYSDTLRALGSFIAKMGASSIEIADLGDHWLVASTLGSETLFETFQLEDLRKEGPLRRGAGDPDCPLSETLRTLGRLLDEGKARSFTLCQVPEGFRLTALSEGEEVARTYSFDELDAIGAKQRRARRESVETSS